MAKMTVRRILLGWAIPLSIIFHSTVVLAYHISTSSNETTEEDMSRRNAHGSTFWERLQAGPSAYTNADKILFGAFITMALEILQIITRSIGRWVGAKEIPVRGKHLDELSPLDRAFIGFNKLATAPFTYFFLRFLYSEGNVSWKLPNLWNFGLAFPCLFLIYDFFYTILHGFLHIKAVYGYIHKHHHHQKAPSRGNNDAVNVNPIEFFLGEYNHLWTIYLFTRVFEVHAVCCVLFVAIGGFLAGINHTRYDMVFSVFGINIFDPKAHDVHHRIPQSNYGQYIMFWDYLFGSYRPYSKNDRINPKYQLERNSGKSFAYLEAKEKLLKDE